ncbi:hypothetical protein GCM10008019_29440 [Deinococcus soli (ex Cha et al. 2016)]|nr:hypothetical protein GCM10008019_29440 [Deinococcus soli (ex Cha et al. 2016)]
MQIDERVLVAVIQQALTPGYQALRVLERMERGEELGKGFNTLFVARGHAEMQAETAAKRIVEALRVGSE